MGHLSIPQMNPEYNAWELSDLQHDFRLLLHWLDKCVSLLKFANFGRLSPKNLCSVIQRNPVVKCIPYH